MKSEIDGEKGNEFTISGNMELTSKPETKAINLNANHQEHELTDEERAMLSDKLNDKNSMDIGKNIVIRFRKCRSSER